MSPPTEHPALRFFDAVQPHPQPNLPGWKIRQLLAGMPPPSADQIRRPGIEINDHLVVIASLEHVETPLQILVEVEFLGNGKVLLGYLGGAKSRQRKGPHGVALRHGGAVDEGEGTRTRPGSQRSYEFPRAPRGIQHPTA